VLLRRILLALSEARWAQNIVLKWPIAKRVAYRFVAGETIDDVVRVTEMVNALGITATLDYLGESVTNAAEAQQVVDAYTQLVEAIAHHGLRAGVSLKLTSLGFDISEEICIENLCTILQTAKDHTLPVAIDMESSAYTSDTLRIYRQMRDEQGFDNVGTVIQSYLYRSEEDMQALAREGAHIRLVKGAYMEPPEVAFPDKADADRNFVHLSELYLVNSSNSFLAIATHDESMIAAVEQIIAEHNIQPSRYEFQMLHGIRMERQQELAELHPMRVYIPFGESWYPYFMRRLAERPANLWFFTKALFSK